MTTTFKSRLLALGLLAFAAAGACAQQQVPPLPIDPQVRYGKLDNGLTYYIRHNENPKQRAEFFIAQNVGAILEEDDQDGLAHFLEHMAFNGTTHYPGKGIISYFESIGVKFGYNINAYTSLDETVYNLSDVPTVREGVIDSALLVLHDWSNSISLLPEEIDAERGVILEEWRTGQGADRRMWKKANEQKYPGSQYAVRDVIGDTAVIKHFDYQTLRDFYHKWYGPDLQAVLVVGDVDVDAVEAKIKTVFADIPRRANFGERPVYPIHDNEQPIIVRVTDPEAQVTRLELEYKHPKLPAEIALSANGYLMSVLHSLVATMLNNRFEEIAMQADAPFVASYAYYGELVKSQDAFYMVTVPRDGREADGLRALMLEAEKMRRFGFTVSELERAKTNMLKSMETAYNDRNNRENGRLVREYVRHFLSDEPIPGIEWEYETLQQMLPQITIDLVNPLAQQYIHADGRNLIVSMTAPDSKAAALPTDEQVLALMAEAEAAELTRRAEDDMDKPLIEQAPKAGKIKKEKQNKALGTTEWTLSNGVRVILKPTDFKEDEILMTAYSPGGLSMIDNVADLPSAAFSTDIIEYTGLADYSAIDLQKLLTGKQAGVSAYIRGYEEGLNGNSSVADFETLMQLTYLYFTAPRRDDEAFNALMNMLRTSLANRDANPMAAFSDSVNLNISDHSPRTVIADLATIERVDQDKALAIYKQRFALPADFTFIFTGNIDPQDEATRTAIATYLGGLTGSKKTEEFIDRGTRTPKGEVDNYFRRSMEVKKASNFILYTADVPYSLRNSMLLGAAADVLDMRYLESIREKEGGSYGVGVAGQLMDEPVEYARLLMQFDTDPDKQARLMDIIHAEVDKIVTEGPRADDLAKVKENYLKQHAEDLEQNGWWQRALVSYYRDGIDRVNGYEEAVNAITAEAVQDMLRQIVAQGNVLEVVMLPE